MTDWVDRYWEKVDVRGADECWPWTAAQDVAGYGRLNVDGKSVLAHRLAWELENGPVPQGLCVLHRCDCPICQNPAHLFVGPHAANMHDMAEKGRSNRSTSRWNAKLTRQDILQIRRLYATGEHTQQTLGARFGVVPSQICHIVTKKQWAWLD